MRLKLLSGNGSSIPLLSMTSRAASSPTFRLRSPHPSRVLSELHFNLTGEGSCPPFIDLGFLGVEGGLHGITAYRFQREHVQLESLCVRHICPHFILNLQTDHVEQVQ